MSTGDASAAARLSVRAVTKSFGDTQALHEISLEAVGGEVLGVAGPNGAGKTTLMRIIAGEESADSGEITLDDAPLSPAEASRVVSVVHQEVQLFPNLTVAENLLVGRSARGTSRRPRPGPDELAVLRELGIEKHANAELGTCSLVVQQLTEIARVLLHEEAAQVFLFDEPNSALTDAESQELFARVQKLKEEGKIVILVTHRLNELVEVADRVAVVRDGACAVTLADEALTEAAVARELVVGTAIESNAKPADSATEAAWDWSVEDWTHGRGAFAGIGFKVSSGEIVALVGVEGSGVRELARSLAGVEQASGRARFDARAAISARIGFLPAERTLSLYPNFSVANNLVSRLGRGEIAGRAGLLRVKALNGIAEELRERFQVRCRTVAQPVTSLSGGNQQKVAIASALAAQPTILVLEEPTRGVDVGAKSEIYRILRSFARDGGAVIALCTEVTEVYELCDRVLLVDGGAVRADLQTHAFPGVTELAERLTVLADLEHDAETV